MYLLAVRFCTSDGLTYLRANKEISESDYHKFEENEIDTIIFDSKPFKVWHPDFYQPVVKATFSDSSPYIVVVEAFPRLDNREKQTFKF